mgnify:FL=1
MAPKDQETMKAATLFSLATVVSLQAQAQNLVPNPSFEDYTSCPPSFGYWMNVIGWTCPYGSVDYFNACHTGSSAGVPHNSCGYQYPSEGLAYVGMFTHNNNNPLIRELFSAQLAAPLLPGVPVCLSFKTAIGGFGTWDGNSATHTCKGIGMKFFVDLPTTWQTYLFPNNAALAIDFVPTDTSVWYTVSSLYVPDSAYTTLVLGNFFSNDSDEITLLDSSGFGNYPGAYAFVDEVYVSFDLTACAGQEAVPDVAGVLPFQVNQTHGTLEIWFQESNAAGRIELVDLAGRVIRQEEFSSNVHHTTLEISALPVGLYLLRVSEGSFVYNALRITHNSP